MSVTVLRSDLDRLPIDAAVGMWSAQTSTSLGPSEAIDAELRRLIDRIKEVPSDRRMQLWQPMIAGLLARGAAAMPRGAMAAFGAALSDDAPTLPIDDLVTIATACWSGDEAIGAVLLEPCLNGARRRGLTRQVLLQSVYELAAVDTAQWREYSAHIVRDVLVGSLCELGCLQGDRKEALRLALVWPPGRSALTALALGLATAQDYSALSALLGRYNSGGALRASVVELLWLDAERRLDDALAAWLTADQPGPAQWIRCRRCTPPALWPRRRQALLDQLVRGDEVPNVLEWLPGSLSNETDAAVGLDDLVVAAYVARPRLSADAFTTLLKANPAIALRRAAMTLRDTISAGALSRSELRRCKADVERAAAAMGEPLLAAGVLGLLRRESEASAMR